MAIDRKVVVEVMEEILDCIQASFDFYFPNQSLIGDVINDQNWRNRVINDRAGMVEITKSGGGFHWDEDVSGVHLSFGPLIWLGNESTIKYIRSHCPIPMPDGIDLSWGNID